jgi:hypothetical protein
MSLQFVPHACLRVVQPDLREDHSSARSAPNRSRTETACTKDGSDGTLTRDLRSVTGRYGATGYDRLRRGITGYGRRFVDERTRL